MTTAKNEDFMDGEVGKLPLAEAIMKIWWEEGGSSWGDFSRWVEMIRFNC